MPMTAGRSFLEGRRLLNSIRSLRSGELGENVPSIRQPVVNIGRKRIEIRILTPRGCSTYKRVVSSIGSGARAVNGIAGDRNLRTWAKFEGRF